MNEFKEIDIHQAKDLISRGNCLIVDIRDRQSYRSGHIAEAQHLEDSNVKDFLKTADKGKKLICYCYHGFSSQMAAKFFKAQGFSETYSIKGGFEAWKGSFESVASEE